MIEIALQPPATLIAIEVWGDAASVSQRLGAPLPPPCRAVVAGDRRVLWLEPNTWLVRSPRTEMDATLALLAEALGEDGAASDVSGAFTRLRVEGDGWRDLLMIAGVFDAESPGFGLGCVAGTVIHHIAVRLDVLSETAVDAYVAPSYAEGLLGHWRRSAARLGAQSPPE